MIVTDLKFDPRRILGPADDGSLPPRSAGPGVLHLSTIYQDIESSIALRERSEFTEKELEFFRAGGFLWERVWSQAFAESIRGGAIVRPGEVYVEGITGSPDNWDIASNRVIETKCTWKSSAKFESLEKYFWLWLVQMKGYCRMVGTKEAELYVFFMMGDYRGSGPQCNGLLLEWTEKEIEDNWKMLKRHARDRGWI